MKISLLLIPLFTLFPSSTVLANCDTLVLSHLQKIKARVEFIQSKMGKPLEKKLLYTTGEGMETYEVSGVPASVKWIEITNRTFRHYSDHADEIAKTRILKSGLVPYVIVHPGIKREIYSDLTGVFVTDPGIPPERVGLERRNYPFVDIRFQPDTLLLKLEEGIYFVPTPPTTPRWLADKYDHFLQTGLLPVNVSEQETIMKLKASGATVESTHVTIDWIAPR